MSDLLPELADILDGPTVAAIARVFDPKYARPDQSYSEQIASILAASIATRATPPVEPPSHAERVSDEDWQRALDCAMSCLKPPFHISRSSMNNAMQHAFGMLSLVASPSPQPHAEREPVAKQIKAVRSLVMQASLGSCTCNTKSPELVWHDQTCRYVTLMTTLDALDLLEELAATASPTDEVQALRAALTSARHHIDAVLRSGESHKLALAVQGRALLKTIDSALQGEPR